MTNDFEVIREAVQKRDQFLNDHPELRPMQEEINHLLAMAGPDKRKRNILLQQLLLESWYRMTGI